MNARSTTSRRPTGCDTGFGRRERSDRFRQRRPWRSWRRSSGGRWPTGRRRLLPAGAAIQRCSFPCTSASDALATLVKPGKDKSAGAPPPKPFRDQTEQFAQKAYTFPTAVGGAASESAGVECALNLGAAESALLLNHSGIRVEKAGDVHGKCECGQSGDGRCCFDRLCRPLRTGFGGGATVCCRRSRR